MTSLRTFQNEIDEIQHREVVKQRAAGHAQATPHKDREKDVKKSLPATADKTDKQTDVKKPVVIAVEKTDKQKGGKKAHSPTAEKAAPAPEDERGRRSPQSPCPPSRTPVPSQLDLRRLGRTSCIGMLQDGVRALRCSQVLRGGSCATL